MANAFLDRLRAMGLYGSNAAPMAYMDGIPPEMLEAAQRQSRLGIGAQLMAAGFARDPRARAEAIAGIGDAADISRPLYNMAQAKLMATPRARETRTATEEVGGRILLIDMDTGETIRDLGPAPVRAKDSGININMGTNENEFQKKRAAALSDRLGEFESEGIAAPRKIGEFQVLSQLLDGMEQGAFAEQKGQIVATLQSLGAPDQVIEYITGLDPNLPASQQAVKKVVSDMTIGKIGPGGFPAQNFSNADLQFVREGQVSINALPEANRLRIKMGIIVEQAKMDANAAWEDYRMQAAEAGMGEAEAFQQFQRDYRRKLEEDARNGKTYFGELKQEIEALKKRGSQPANTSTPATSVPGGSVNVNGVTIPYRPVQ